MKMLSLSAKKRKDFKKKVKNLREKGILPGVLYGPGLENVSLEIDLKEFEKVFEIAGESSLIKLLLDKKEYLALVYALEFDTLTRKPIHVDFYQPKLDEEIKVTIPLVFEGESPAVKEMSGTLIKNIHELEVKAVPQKLPHEIKVDVEKLKAFEDNILIKDLEVPEGVKIEKEPDEIVALVTAPQKVEEELAKPVEEKVEEVEKVEGKKPADEEAVEGEKEKEKEKETKEKVK